MFQVIVIPNNTTSNLSLCFKTEERASVAHESIISIMQQENGLIRAGDDFGNELVIPSKNISYTMLIDVSRSQWREWEQMRCVEKTRAVLGKRPALLAS